MTQFQLTSDEKQSRKVITLYSGVVCHHLPVFTDLVIEYLRHQIQLFFFFTERVWRKAPVVCREVPHTWTNI